MATVAAMPLAITQCRVVRLSRAILDYVGLDRHVVRRSFADKLDDHLGADCRGAQDRFGQAATARGKQFERAVAVGLGRRPGLRRDDKDIQHRRAKFGGRRLGICP